MILETYGKDAKKTGTVEAPDRLFSRAWNADLVHQALRTQQANKRKVIAHAKTRGEVSGGGKKPWRQKGTGRARHGSIRSPIWIGGGATHGPLRDRIFKLKLNKKMRQGAIFSVLSRRVKDGEVTVVDSMELSGPKTSELNTFVRTVTAGGQHALLIPKDGNKNIYMASRNLENVRAISPKSLNVYDLLRYKKIILEKDAIGQMEEHYKAVK